MSIARTKDLCSLKYKVSEFDALFLVLLLCLNKIKAAKACIGLVLCKSGSRWINFHVINRISYFNQLKNAIEAVISNMHFLLEWDSCFESSEKCAMCNFVNSIYFQQYNNVLK